MFLRRHHCRRWCGLWRIGSLLCVVSFIRLSSNPDFSADSVRVFSGNIFCGDCSSKTFRLPQIDKAPVRVCDTCHDELSSENPYDRETVSIQLLIDFYYHCLVYSAIATCADLILNANRCVADMLQDVSLLSTLRATLGL